MKEKLKTAAWLAPWFAIYVMARIIYTPFVWKNMPHFKNWMACTAPGFKGEHTKVVVFTAVALAIFACTYALEEIVISGVVLGFQIAWAILWTVCTLALTIEEKKEKL
jgi:hypothetical protein